MKIKQIAHNHVEVTVTAGDLQMFDMNIESLAPDSPNLKSFLFKILEQVNSKTGMDVKSGQVFVEAKKDEKAIVFTIKRMGLTKEEKREKYKNARAVVKKAEENVYIYGFESFSDMTAALTKIDEEMLLNSTVYIFEKVYYCAFRTDCKFEKYNSVLCEFCHQKDEFDFTEAILGEHGECIAKGERVISLLRGIQEYGL